MTKHKTLKLVLTILFLLIFINVNHSQDINKVALIIAISDYPEGTGWANLCSDRDAILIKQILINQKFPEENISVLSNENATKDGIEHALMKLVDQTKGKEPDYVLIHYSGHGQQITDNNGDEYDNYDEAFVAYGAPCCQSLAKNYNGENHFRDDDFGKYIDQIKINAGQKGQVIVFIDACCSGTGTRGGVVAEPGSKQRGGHKPFDIDGKLPSSLNTKVPEENGSGIHETTFKAKGNTAVNSKYEASFILITAASSNEPSYEAYDDNGNEIGSLSYAIAKAFSETTCNEVSFLNLFSKIQTIMADMVPDQTPTMEGDENAHVFNDGISIQEPYFEIREVVSANKIKINAGMIYGVNEGDEICLYKSGTGSIKGEIPVLKGSVIESDNFSSVVEFENNHEIKNEKQFWAFVTAYKFKNSKLIVTIDRIMDNDLEEIITHSLEGYEYIELSKNHGEILISEEIDNEGNTKKSPNNKNISLILKQNGVLIKSFPFETETLIENLRNYSQIRFIKGLDLKDPEHSVELEIVPVILKRGKGNQPVLVNGEYIITDTLNITDFTFNGNIQLTKDDCIMFKVTNNGSKDACFAIVEISCDGSIFQFIPAEEMKEETYKIKAGESRFISDFVIDGYGDPKLGTEIFKVFATDIKSPLYLSSEKGKGAGSPLQHFVSDRYQDTKSKDDKKFNTGTIPAHDSGSTYEIRFEMVEKRPE